MHTGFRNAFLAALVLASRSEPASGAANSADEVLAEDRIFAAMSVDRGQAAAFEEFLTGDAIIFRPGAVVAQDWLATHEQGGGRLEWTPSAGAADCSGAWAVTTGPWTYSSPEGDESASGHYLSIWRREPDGHWRVVLDNGVDDDPGSEPLSPLQSVFAGFWPASSGKGCRIDGGAAGLKTAEQDLNESVAADGLARALVGVAAVGALAYRDDTVPGLIAAAAAADGRYGRGSQARTQFVSIEPDSDFGFSYGIVEARPASPSQPAARASYVRIWCREGRKWRVAIDMLTPLDAGSGP